MAGLRRQRTTGRRRRGPTSSPYSSSLSMAAGYLKFQCLPSVPSNVPRSSSPAARRPYGSRPGSGWVTRPLRRSPTSYSICRSLIGRCRCSSTSTSRAIRPSTSIPTSGSVRHGCRTTRRRALSTTRRRRPRGACMPVAGLSRHSSHGATEWPRLVTATYFPTVPTAAPPARWPPSAGPSLASFPPTSPVRLQHGPGSLH